MLLVWEVWLVQEDTWFADSDMARKLDIGCGFTYCTVCCDTSIAWEHALSPGTKEFVCAVWQRDEQYQDCWQAVGHGVLTGSGAWCVVRQWGMVCWQAVGHGMLTGSGAWCVDRQWGMVCWQAVGHGVLTGSEAWCVDRQWGMVCWQAVGHGVPG